MAQKIIFLDIDGVLNTINHMKRQLRSTGEATIKNWCPIACNHICALCEHYQAGIVITSLWRYKYDMEEMAEFFRLNHIPPKYLIGRTAPTAPQPEREDYCKGYEIRRWLEEFPEEVSSYVIIDDEAIMLDEQQPYLVRVDKRTGLALKSDVVKAGRILANHV